LPAGLIRRPLTFRQRRAAFATTYRGGELRCLCFEVESGGNSLAYSTFLGGGENDSAIGIAADASGIAYVTGGTRSAGFPTTASRFPVFLFAGDTDAYLVKFNAAGSAILYSTIAGRRRHGSRQQRACR